MIAALLKVIGYWGQHLFHIPLEITELQKANFSSITQ
jgi:hypothetical protein